MISIGCTQVGSHEFLTVCAVDEDPHDVHRLYTGRFS